MARGALALDDPASLALLTAGLGILANNTGNYGRAGPAIGRGALMGLQQYIPMAAAKRDEERRKAAAEGLLGAFQKQEKPVIKPKVVGKAIPGKTPNFNPNVPEPTFNEFAPDFAQAFGAQIPETPEGVPPAGPVAQTAKIDPALFEPIVGRQPHEGRFPYEPTNIDAPPDLLKSLGIEGSSVKMPGPDLAAMSVGGTPASIDAPQDFLRRQGPEQGPEFRQPGEEDLQLQMAAANQAKQGALAKALGAANGALAIQPQLDASVAQTDALMKQRGALSQPAQPGEPGQIDMQTAADNGALSPQQIKAIAEFSNVTGDYSLLNDAFKRFMPSTPEVDIKEINGNLVAVDKRTGRIVNQQEFRKPEEAYTLSPGQRRFGDGNKEIAAVSETDDGIKVVREFNAMLDQAGITDPVKRQKKWEEYTNRRGSGVQVNVNDKPSPGYRWTEDGRGQERIPGGPADELGEVQQKQVIGARNLNNGIKEYRQALTEFTGSDWLNPNKRALIQSKYQNMLLQAKEAYNLGVLNGPDFRILQEVVTDPTSIKGGILSAKTLDTQASELSRIMGTIEETTLSGPIYSSQSGKISTENNEKATQSAPATLQHKGATYSRAKNPDGSWATKNGRPAYQSPDGKIISWSP
jgi:hypothetical protein